MANLKLMVAFSMLVLATSWKESDAKVGDMCWNLNIKLGDLRLKGQEALDYAMEYFSGGNMVEKAERNKLKEALESVMEGQECSPSSLDHITTINSCAYGHWVTKMGPVMEPAVKHAFKCFTPDYIKQTLLANIQANKAASTASDQLRRLIDEQFAADAREANPRFGQQEIADIKPTYEGFVKPLAKLVEREFQRQGKDSRELVKDVDEFIFKLVSQDCAAYTEATNLLTRIDSIGMLYEADFKKVYRLLDQEAQLMVLRHNLCNAVKIPNWSLLAEMVVKDVVFNK